MRKVDKIIIHCAASNIDDKNLFEIVNQWHLNRGWSGCGYHYLIRRDGGLVLGRSISKIGAHCKGQNRGSIGIMLNGDTRFTDKQYSCLRDLCYNLMSIFDLSKKDIYPHYEFNMYKTCPNFDVDKFIRAYMVY